MIERVAVSRAGHNLSPPLACIRGTDNEAP
jgi:hypothetical protein